MRQRFRILKIRYYRVVAIDILITFPLIIEFHSLLQAQVVFAFLVSSLNLFLIFFQVLIWQSDVLSSYFHPVPILFPFLSP